MMKFLFSSTVAFLCLINIALAQPSVNKLKQKLTAAASLKNDKRDNVTLIAPGQLALLFDGNELSTNDVSAWLANNLELRNGVDVLRENSPAVFAINSLEVSKFSQYFKGIKVEHGMINTTSKNGHVSMLQLEFYSIPDNFSISPAISQKTALSKAALAMEVPSSVIAGYGQPGGMPLPKGELVIIRTYKNDSAVCLAWKFDIFNENPVGRANVFIDAQTGRVVLIDELIKHANQTGTAATRYSGSQSIVTDNGGADPAKPFRLRQSRNGHSIITLNYQKKEYNPALNDPLATDFTDNDNNWTATEFNNSTQDDAALDVQLNMQFISDYWKTVQNRSSWDNLNTPLRSFVHVSQKCGTATILMDNAFWSGSAMYFGDGNFGHPTNACQPSYFKPVVSLDVTAHEVAHGITQSTCGLIYRWESGALNEAFSDIWGAVIEKWSADQVPTISAGKSTWLIAEEITQITGKGIRDMKTPGNFNHPSSYKDPNWRNADYTNCSPATTNDQCGVHRNSGVLNKWFYLITEGEASINTLNQPYNVTGIGMVKSANLAYLTELNLTPNAGFSTTKAVSMNAAITLFGAGSAEVETVRTAWRAVGVDSAIWTGANTPIFAANNVQGFLSIGIGKDNLVWAGTDKKGLYVYYDTGWAKRAEITNVRINDIKSDANGGIWVAQSGTVNSGIATAGGVNYFADPAAAMTGFYTVSTQTNVPTRNVRSIFVDKTRLNNGTDPRVWIATNTYINSAGNSVSGKPALGFNVGSPSFTTISSGIDIGTSTVGVTAIGGNKNVVWTFAPANYGKNQIISYNAASGGLMTVYDNSTVATIPLNITVTSIYTDVLNRTWFGLTANAVLVYDELHVWHYINFSSIFIPGGTVNNNAITGTRYGDVYIGTSTGLIFFDSGYGTPVINLDFAENYKLFTKPNGLPSSNITGIAYDAQRFRVWVATDQGICMWNPLCIGLSCNASSGFLGQAESVHSGNWSDTATWSSKMIPDSATVVFISDSVIVDINAKCKSLDILPGATLTVKPNLNLKVYENEEVIISNGRRGRRRR